MLSVGSGRHLDDDVHQGGGLSNLPMDTGTLRPLGGDAPDIDDEVTNGAEAARRMSGKKGESGHNQDLQVVLVGPILSAVSSGNVRVSIDHGHTVEVGSGQQCRWFPGISDELCVVVGDDRPGDEVSSLREVNDCRGDTNFVRQFQV